MKISCPKCDFLGVATDPAQTDRVLRCPKCRTSIKLKANPTGELEEVQAKPQMDRTTLSLFLFVFLAVSSTLAYIAYDMQSETRSAALRTAIQKEIAGAEQFAAANEHQQALDHYATALALGEDSRDEQLVHQLKLAETRRDESFALVEAQRIQELELANQQRQRQAQMEASQTAENQRRNLEVQTTATNRQVPQQDQQKNARAVEEACQFITKTIERKSHINYGLFSELFVHRISVTPGEIRYDVNGTTSSFIEDPRPKMEWVTTQAISFKDIDPEGVLLRRVNEEEFFILLRTTNGKKSGSWNNATRNRPDLKSKTGVLPPETSTESIDALTFDVSNVSSDDRETLTNYFRLLASSAGGKISSPKLARLEQWGENLNAPFKVGDEVTGSDFISGVIISVGEGACRVKVTDALFNSAYLNGSTYDFLTSDLKKRKPPRVN